MSAPACAPSSARDGGRTALEIADVVRLHGEALRRARALGPEQHAVLRDIVRCRTAALGGHVEVCTRCGHARPSYNSCRNRHCPKCQALSQARWVATRAERLLAVPYFHVVFTLPAELRAIAKLNRRRVFNAIFQAASAALLELGLDEKRLGALFGVTAVLHTWTRELRFHPHLHCIVTGGGWSVRRGRWIACRASYLLPVRPLGALFRGKLLAILRGANRTGALRLPGEAGPADPECFERLCGRLLRKSWVLYAKRPFGQSDHVVRYLGRYTHRVGLSNDRLVRIDEHGVTWRTKNGQTVTAPPVDFLGRFVQHVLPKGLVKIRHFGLFAGPNVSTLLPAARAGLDRPAAPPPPAPDPMHESAPRVAALDFRALLRLLTGIDLCVCRACGARAVVRRPLPDARAPPAGAA